MNHRKSNCTVIMRSYLLSWLHTLSPKIWFTVKGLFCSPWLGFWFILSALGCLRRQWWGSSMPGMGYAAGGACLLWWYWLVRGQRWCCPGFRLHPTGVATSVDRSGGRRWRWARGLYRVDRLSPVFRVFVYRNIGSLVPIIPSVSFSAVSLLYSFVLHA